MAIIKAVAILAAILVSSTMAQDKKTDVTSGLDCVKDTDGKPIACKGNNNVLQTSETKIKEFIKNNNQDVQNKINDLQTRFGSGPAQGGSRPGTPQYCNKGSCQTTVNQIYTPTLLYNTYGEPRFVLQLQNFNQFIYLSVCDSGNTACNKYASCEQKKFAYTLLVWDPFYPEAGLYVESFDVPSGCCCSGRGY